MLGEQRFVPPIASGEVALMVLPLDPHNRSAIEALVSSYVFHDYRYFHGIPPEQVRVFIVAQLVRTLTEDSGVVWGAWEGSALVGLAHLMPLPWESAHFGFRMLEVQHLIASGLPAQRQMRARALLEACLRDTHQAIDCLVHRIDAEDHPVIHALETCGFRLLDTVMSYLFPWQILSRVRSASRARYGVRPMSREDVASIVAIAQQTNINKGRHYADVHFDRQKVDDMYLRWVERCCDGTLADRVIVAERAGQVVGFITYRLLTEFARATGITIAGRGLLSVLPQHAGAGVALFREATLLGGPEAEFGEFDVRATNPPMLRLCGAFGMRLAHVRHVFHYWPNDEPRRAS